MPGPRDIRDIRTDSLVDMGVPDAADGVLIRDATDGVVKIANVSDVGITDHGGLTGLADDDHPQYLNVARHDSDDHSALTITESQITDLAHLTIEQVQDNLGTAFIVGGTDLSTVYDDVANTLTLNVDNLDASKITTGQFANARISQSSVTQHQASLTITQSQISDLDHLTIEEVQDNLGGGFVVGGNNLTVTYDDVANTLTFAVDALVASDITAGAFADARISQSSVTQHEAALTITESQISNLDHLTVEEVQDNLGTAFIVGGTDITVVYDDVANTLTFNKDALVAADIPSLDASKITTGQFANARISEASVTQYQAALTITESQISNLDHLTIEEVQDNLGTLFIVGGTDITVVYDDVANTLTFNKDALVAADIPSLDTSKITTGTFADARIAQTNVTQHQAALTITESQISDLNHYDATDFNLDFALKSTSDLSEGTNLYYTTSRVNSDIDVRVDKAFVDALNVDADTLDGIDSTQFLRTDTNNTTTGTLYINNNEDVSLVAGSGSLVIGTTTSTNVAIDNNEIQARNNTSAAVLNLNNLGGQVIVGSGGLNSIGTISQNGTSVSLSNHTHAAGNATTLDGIDSTGFLRSNTNDTFTGGTLTVAATLSMSGAHDINMNARSIVNLAHIDGAVTNRARHEIHSNSSGGNYDEQSAHLMVGESADALTTTGSPATMHLAYSGDGYGYLGMGGRLTSSNYQPYWDFFELDYNSVEMRYLQQRGGTNNANRLPNITGWDTLRIRDNDGIFGYDGSSIRWKENVRDWEDWTGVLDLMPVIFDWADEYAPCYEHERVEPDGTVTGGPHVHDETCNREDIGLIAEEVNEIDPRLVKLDDEGKPRSVRYEMLTVYLIAAVKEIAEHLGITEEVKARGLPPGQGGATGQGKRAPVPPAQRRGKGWRTEPVEPRPEPRPPAIWPEGVDANDYPVGTHPQDVIEGWVPLLVDRTEGIAEEDMLVEKPDWTIEMGRAGARAQGKHTRPPPE